MKSPLLDQLVQQYLDKHQKPPQRILVTPPAAIALGIKGALASTWNQVPISIDDNFVAVADGPSLGIVVIASQVTGVDAN